MSLKQESVYDYARVHGFALVRLIRIAIARTNYEGVRPQSFRLQTELLIPTRAQRMRLHRGSSYKLRG